MKMSLEEYDQQVRGIPPLGCLVTTLLFYSLSKNATPVRAPLDQLYCAVHYKDLFLTPKLLGNQRGAQQRGSAEWEKEERR
jgi:hypothetical protein